MLLEFQLPGSKGPTWRSKLGSKTTLSQAGQGSEPGPEFFVFNSTKFKPEFGSSLSTAVQLSVLRLLWQLTPS
eukprot:2911783-Rhodomonas_salina.1